jgi:hypothetical protein
MTNFTTRVTIAAATLVVAAGAASAQTLKAEIPFTFRAGNTVMAAGTYQVSRILQPGGTSIFHLKDASGPGSVILMPAASGDVRKSWVAKGAPLLSFMCSADRCSLAQIWTGTFAPVYTIPQAKPDKEEPVHMALIEMRPEKSE